MRQPVDAEIAEDLAGIGVLAERILPQAGDGVVRLRQHDVGRLAQHAEDAVAGPNPGVADVLAEDHVSIDEEGVVVGNGLRQPLQRL